MHVFFEENAYANVISQKNNVLGISYFIVFLNLKFVLTHLLLDKIETKLLMMTFKWIFFNKNWLVLKSVPWGVVEEKSLVQIMAWCWTGNKPLSEAVMTQVSNTFMTLGGD